MEKAIIITGLPRCLAFNKNEILKLCKKYDVFFITNRTLDVESSILANMKSVIYIDDIDYESKLEQHLISIPEGKKILQWQKLKLGKEIIRDYENKNNVKYKLILKLRTDLKFNDDIEISNCDNNTVYMKSDYYFYAKRDVFFKVCDFFDRVNYYYNNFGYVPIYNTNSIINSDIKCAKFQWLNYPDTSDIKKLKTNELCIEKIHEAFHSNKEKNDVSFNFRERHKEIIFPSEAAFLHYLLSSGITVKKINNFNFSLLKHRRNSISNILDKIYDINFIQRLKPSDHGLTNKHADFFKNLALSYVDFDTEKSFNLMLLAKRIRPNGPFINKKLKELRGKK